jgi:hypothetical protein
VCSSPIVFYAPHAAQWVDSKDDSTQIKAAGLILGQDPLMGTAVLIADENFRIHQFNDSLLNLFDSAAAVSTIRAFGEVGGCVNAVKESNLAAKPRRAPPACCGTRSFKR